MPRIRTIKPEFWTDEKLSLLDPTTRLVFLGLISMADDHGRLIDNVKSLDGMLFPNTDDTCRDALDILARLSRILRYTSASGQHLIQIAGWRDHQKVDHPAKPLLPGPDDAVYVQPADAPTDTGANSKDSREPRESVARTSRSDLGPTTYDLRPTTKRHSGSADPASDDEAFEHAWATYPQRAGHNPKRDARHAWDARRRGGDTAEAMTAGVERYRRFVEHQGQVGTPFVMQARRFFGPSRAFAEPWDVPEDPIEAALMAERQAAEDDQVWIAQRAQAQGVARQ